MHITNDQKLKILVVDDHRFVAESTKAILMDIDGIAFVDNANDEMQCMNKILDYPLPGEQGTEVFERIKREYPSTKIVVFTDLEVKEVLNCFVSLEVDGILSKKDNIKSLKNMVACVLDNQTMISLLHFCGTLS
ncbi:response regulator [Paenibacillus periandrae]|uniref:response regulator n=1 Tax=Paenibacillus periandrae TaxID=1761741 RepID=UPI001F09F8DD|nr:response regulator [Paenibacillus periandrae]